MKPRTKVRILSSAPPQYHGKQGWAMTQNGPYWTVTLEGGGEAMLHASEIEPVDPPADAEPETATVMVGHCPVTVPASTVPPHQRSAPLAGWPAYSADYQAGFKAGYAEGQKASSVSAMHAQQAADFAVIRRLPPKPDHD